ncbi:MAG TPA: M48 family metalloprotease [Clostridia bacterium]|nr:M48 family metalloprotease [Clostridia bacterium]
MSGLFYQLGRRLGQAAIPTARKTRWAWRLLTGSDEESLQAEVELGTAMARELHEHSTPVTRPAESALLEEISAHLAARLKNQARVFRAEIIQTGSANALSLPGGFIFVDTLLVDLCDAQPDQLAFIVGHEMGHVVRKHTVDRLVAEIGMNVITTLMTRGSMAGFWKQGGQELLRKAYGRDQEREADEFGLRLARAAGYDPQGALNLMLKLRDLRQSSGGLSDYFASHPPEADRYARLQQVLRQIPG